MSNYELKGNNISVIVEGEKNTVKITKGKTVWNMTELPFVKFTDDSVFELTNPVNVKEYSSVTLNGICFEYENVGGKGISVKTSVEVEKVSNNVNFYVSVDNDEQGAIEHVSYPAPFDFGLEYGDSAELDVKNLPVCYSVLPRMQGMLVPAGTKIILYDKGIMFERDARMAFFGQIRYNDGYIAIFETPFDAAYELRNENGEKAAPMWRPSLGRMS